VTSRPAAIPAQGEPFRAVLVGAGAMGAVWLKALDEAGERLGLRLVALADMDVGRAAAAARAAGRPDLELAPGLDAALDAAEAHIVIDCTVPAARLAVSGRALERGRHVLCEKPLAPDMATAHALVALSERAGRRLAVSQNRRFQPAIRRIRAAVEARLLGLPTTVHCTLHMAPRFGGFREAMPHAFLLDMAIHAFDAVRAMLGRDALEVLCVERNPAGSRFAHGSEAVALFRMEGDVLFHFAGSWAEHGPPTDWNGAWRIAFERGAIRWNGSEVRAYGEPSPTAPEVFLPAPRPVALPDAPAGEESDILGSLQSFLEALRSGSPPETRAEDNIASLAMVLAAVGSAAEGGRWVPVGAQAPAATEEAA